MTRPATLGSLAIALVLAGCERGSSGDCGNGVVELGEQCDDGNDVAGDGCDACALERPVVCGDGNIDDPEQCDDGNTRDGDSCTATCELPGVLRVVWTFEQLDGTVLGCPAANLDRIDIAGSGSHGFSRAFACSSGSASLLLPRDLYTVSAVASTNGSTFAVTPPAPADLRTTDQTFAARFFSDAGVVHVGWQLVGADTNQIASCGTAGIATIDVVTVETGLVDRFDCAVGNGFTSPLAVGVYRVVLEARDAGGQVIATSFELDATVMVPVGQADLGLVPISIPGL